MSFYELNHQPMLQAIGIDNAALQAAYAPIKAEVAGFVKAVNGGDFPAFSLTTKHDDLPALQAIADDWCNRFKHIVIIGVGGSSLGAQFLVQFELLRKRRSPEIHFIDNADPSVIEDLLTELPLAKTGVLAVSKSGGTIEPLLELLLFIDAYQQRELPLFKHMLIITENTVQPFANLAKKYRIPTLEHNPKIGGRYTIFSNVGILPALFAGMDIKALRKGAATVLNDFQDNLFNSAPVQGALTLHAAAQQGKTINVFFPYGDKLRLFNPWLTQLWNESLGKEGQGTTLLGALGSTDQHSSLQLFLDGRHDKTFSFIIAKAKHTKFEVTAELAAAADNQFLAGISAGELLYAQGHGTADAIAARNLPVRRFELEKLDTATLGALLMHSMLETVITSFLQNVNAFDQPAVEEGKKRTLAILQQKS